MKNKNFIINLKCLYCNQVLKTYDKYEENKNKGFLFCQHCKKKNDYNTLMKITEKEVKKIAKDETISILKKAFKNNKFIKIK